MKVRTVLVTALVVAGLGGGVFGAVKYRQSHKSKVQVAPVSTVSQSMSFWDGDEETITGNLISMNSQMVQLNTDYDLMKVYVKAGDKVKIGDPLMEYDMTREQLEREMEILRGQISEMNLSSQEKYLETLLTNPAQALASNLATSGFGDSDDADSADEYDRTESADIPEGDFAGEGDLAGGGDGGSGGDSGNGGDSGSGGSGGDSGNGGDSGDIIDGEVIDDPIGSGDDSGDVIGDGGDGSDDIPDDGEDALIDDISGGDGDLFVDDQALFDIGDEGVDDGQDGQGSADDPESPEGTGAEPAIDDREFLLSAAMTQFVTLEQLVRNYQYTEFEKTGDISAIVEEDLTRALELFEEELSAMPDPENGTVKTFTDALGEEREEDCFVLSGEVKALLEKMQARGEAGEEPAPVNAREEQFNMYRAFVRLLFYDLNYRNAILEKAMTDAGVTADTADAAFVASVRPVLMDVVNAYYRFRVNWQMIRKILEEDFEDFLMLPDDLDALDEEYEGILKRIAGENIELSEETDGTVSKLLSILNNAETVEDPQPETTPVTEEPVPVEPDYPDDDYGDDDFDEGGDEPEFTREEVEEAIQDAREAIKETKLVMREIELKLKQLERKLSGKVVRATINGVIKNAGEVDAPSLDDAFIVVTGSTGMYVQGTVNELKLETLKVGDTVTGTSDETGDSFTATVTEISPYPNESDENSYSWYSSDNGNSSSYPFLAYIEDAHGLEEGTVSMQFADKEESAGFYLDNAFIREDAEGNNYVMIKGEDGLLKKQVVRTGKDLWGSSTEIISGITTEDMIAFPYGRRVVPGAPVEEVEYFTE